MVEVTRYKIEQYLVMHLLSLAHPPVFIHIIHGTRSSLSGLECIVHQYRDDDDQSFDQYLHMVLCTHQ